jgi:hypothetical protein
MNLTAGTLERLEELAGIRKGDRAVRYSDLELAKTTLRKATQSVVNGALEQIDQPPATIPGEGDFDTWWQAIEDGLIRIAQAEDDLAAAIAAINSVNETVDAATITLNERIETASDRIDSTNQQVSQAHDDIAAEADRIQGIIDNLTANYITGVVVEERIETSISAYNDVIDSEGGIVQQVRANLAQNYYTAVSTDEAIAAASLELSSRIGDVEADLSQNYLTYTGTTQAIAAASLTLGGRIGDVEADLTNNYYTATETDSALAVSRTELRSEISDADDNAIGLSEDPAFDRGGETLTDASTGGAVFRAMVEVAGAREFTPTTDDEVGGQDFLATGYRTARTRRRWAIDRARRYKITFRVKLNAEAVTGRVYLGVTTYTADGNPAPAYPDYSPDNHVNQNHYFAHGGSANSFPADTWVEKSGEFDGSQIRPDAAFMRLVIFANHAGDETQITRLSLARLEDITEVSTVSANLANNYYTFTDTEQAIAAASLTLGSRIGDVEADLSQNYLTSAETGQAIAAADQVLRSDLDDVTADLATNYLTSAETGEAIASSSTDLRATLLGQNLIVADGATGPGTWTNTPASTERPPYANPSDLSLRWNSVCKENGITYPGNVLGKKFRLRGWFWATVPFTVTLRGTRSDNNATNQLLNPNQPETPATDGWEFLTIEVDDISWPSINYLLQIITSSGPVYAHKPTFTETGTFAQVETQIEQQAFTISDQNGALAVLRNEIEAEYTGAIGEGAAIFAVQLVEPGDLDGAAATSYPVTKITPGPYGQASALRIENTGGGGTPPYLRIPARVQTLLAGQDLRIDMLVRPQSGTNMQAIVMRREENSGAANLSGITSGTGWQWVTIRTADETEGDTPPSIRVRPASGTMDIAQVLVRHAATADEVPEIGTLSGNVSDILALDLDSYSGTALAQLMTQLAVDANGTSATITQQGTAIADIEGNVNALYKIEVKAGTSGAILQLLAANGQPSVAQLDADFIYLKGKVNVESLSVGMGGNLLTNTDFRQKLRGWARASGDSSVDAQTELVLMEEGGYAAGVTDRALGLRQASNHSAGYARIFSQHESVTGGRDYAHVGVTPNAWYEFSAQLRTRQCDGDMYIRWMDTDGNYLSTSAIQSFTQDGTNIYNPAEWTRTRVMDQAPSNAAYANMVVRKYGSNGTNGSDLFMFRPQFCQTTAFSTEVAPYKGGITTIIDQDGLYSNAVVARHVAADQINANHMTINSIDGKRGHIVALSVDTLQVAGRAITAPDLVRSIGMAFGGSFNLNQRTITSITIGRTAGYGTKIEFAMDCNDLSVNGGRNILSLTLWRGNTKIEETYYPLTHDTSAYDFFTGNIGIARIDEDTSGGNTTYTVKGQIIVANGGTYSFQNLTPNNVSLYTIQFKR